MWHYVWKEIETWVSGLTWQEREHVHRINWFSFYSRLAECFFFWCSLCISLVSVLKLNDEAYGNRRGRCKNLLGFMLSIDLHINAIIIIITRESMLKIRFIHCSVRLWAACSFCSFSFSSFVIIIVVVVHIHLLLFSPFSLFGFIAWRTFCWPCISSGDSINFWLRGPLYYSFSDYFANFIYFGYKFMLF